MTSDNTRQRLAQLRQDSTRSLRSFTRQNILMSPGAQDGGSAIARAGPPSGLSQASAFGSSVNNAGHLTVNVNLTGGAVFLDDERRVRALAKEIKRLITEDGRRGLGIGR